jgi:hypothetical protein
MSCHDFEKGVSKFKLGTFAKKTTIETTVPARLESRLPSAAGRRWRRGGRIAKRVRVD